MQDLVKPSLFTERPTIAVTGQSAIDEARVDGFEPRVIDAEPGRHRWTKILDQHIGRLHHPMEDSKPLGLLQIECQRPLAAIGAEKKPAFAGKARRKLAQHVAFGAGDFTLDVNMAWSRLEAELAFARARIATASRAAGIEAPFDTVWVDLADEEGLEMSARTALGFGFQGKMCIHPNQIGIVNRVFTPDEVEVAYAERVVGAFAEAEAAGSAALQLDGKFIDYPILYRAQWVLEKMAAIRAKEEQR